MNPPVSNNTRRAKTQRIANRSISEEIPLPQSQQTPPHQLQHQHQQQQQYTISNSSIHLSHPHSVGASADVVFINGDVVEDIYIELWRSRHVFFFSHMILHHRRHQVQDKMPKVNVDEISKYSRIVSLLLLPPLLRLCPFRTPM